MKKFQTMAMLVIGAAIGFVAAQERLPWQLQATASPTRASVSECER